MLPPRGPIAREANTHDRQSQLTGRLERSEEHEGWHACEQQGTQDVMPARNRKMVDKPAIAARRAAATRRSQNSRKHHSKSNTEHGRHKVIAMKTTGDIAARSKHRVDRKPRQRHQLVARLLQTLTEIRDRQAGLSPRDRTKHRPVGRGVDVTARKLATRRSEEVSTRAYSARSRLCSQQFIDQEHGKWSRGPTRSRRYLKGR